MVARLFLSLMTLAFCTSILGSSANGATIEADPGKKYELTKNRGPWMISVATFHSASPDGVTRKGKSPEEAAHELIIELRELGMPAYMYVHEPDQQRVSVKDVLGREEYKKNLRRVRSVLVIAGNYDDIDDKLAQDSLKWIKKLNPECLQTGVVFQATEARPTPLSGAFLTINPLLSPEEVQQNRQDPLLVRLNSGQEYSLYENPGEYTLVVKRFLGKSQTVKPGDKLPSITQFLKDNDLDDAGEAAQELVTILRGRYDEGLNNSPGIFNEVEAYVWHDRHESFVTVGSFSSPNDGAIKKYMEAFSPRLVTFENGSQNFQPVHLSIAGFGKGRNETRLFVFDPEPQLIRVPKKR
ncbi:hypothetical protein KOR42_42580 [Thalassoglobus neptunius]|uniref:Uncharacterized protein n=1 Tax=Thalassoglobus neptunius TaxID=1938619 RepID=A0A5C5W8E2_9PLAN|nr:hypothetical protein [Thalassoglobus neptunius]TWT46990.1 hypothetical protein KOR42_42580 [Thalassoglobus neptunius]